MKIFFIVLCCLTLSNCRSSSSSDKYPEIVTYPFCSTISSLSDIIQSIEVIPLTKQNDFILGFMPRILHRDSCFYIGDPGHSKLIYRFRQDGHFLNTIGAFGKGPGEYLSLSDFYVDETTDDIYTLSYPDLRLYRFDKEGNFKGMKTQKYNPGSFLLKNDTFWVYGGNNNGYMPEQLIRCDTNLNIIDKLCPLDTKTIHISLGPVFSQWKDQAFLIMGFDPQVYRLGQDTLLPLIRFDFGKCNISASYWESKDPLQAVMDLQNKGFCNLNNFMVNDEYFISEQNEQRGSNHMQTWYVCAVKHRISGKWDWIRKEISGGGLVVDDQKNEPSEVQPEWYMGKIHGFTKDGRLMILPDGMSLESMPAADKALISNPQALNPIDPETTTVLFLCTLK